MSRRSLYRHSTRHSTQPYITEIDDNVVHWSKEWVSPIINSSDSSISATGQPSNSGTPVPPGAVSASGSPSVNGNSTGANGKPGLGFSVKMWTIVESSPPPIDDGNEGDLLDLARYSMIKVEPEKPQPTQGGLSAADIRGAVGGESIPGIANYSSNEGRKEEKDDQGQIKESKTSEVMDIDRDEKVGGNNHVVERETSAVASDNSPETSKIEQSKPSIEQSVNDVTEGSVDKVIEKSGTKATESVEEPSEKPGQSIESPAEQISVKPVIDKSTEPKTETTLLKETSVEDILETTPTVTETATEIATGTVPETVPETTPTAPTAPKEPETEDQDVPMKDV